MAFTFKDEQVVRKIVKEEVKDQLTDFRSDMVSRLDTILKVTTDTQQELLVLSQKSVEHTNELEDHEDRLNNIETSLQISPS